LIQVVLELGRKPDGSRTRKFFYGRTRPEALQKKKEYEDQLNKGSALDPLITVSEWVSIIKDTYRSNINPLYLKKDDAPYDRLVRAIGERRVVDIRESDLQKAYNEVAGMSFSTVSKYGIVIKKVFGKARKNKIIADDPSEDLIRPHYTTGTHRCLEGWEIDLILANWYNEDARTGIWVMLMLLCGLRRGEMMALRWEHVDMEARKITICEVAVIAGNQSVIEDRAKSRAGERTLPMPKALFEALSTTPASLRSGLVCLSAKGAQLTRQAVMSGIYQFCVVMTRIVNGEPSKNLGGWANAKKKVPKKDRVLFEFRCHDLRHTYATALHDADVPLKAAQYFLGHGDIRITIELYTHLSKEKENLSRDRLISHFDNWIDKRVIEMGKNLIDLPEYDFKFE
jgi:integrase